MWLALSARGGVCGGGFSRRIARVLDRLAFSRAFRHKVALDRPRAVALEWMRV